MSARPAFGLCRWFEPLRGGSFNDMWIRTTLTDSAGTPTLSELRVPGTDDYVTFSENGKAQVTSDVGEQLIDQYDSIEPVDTANGSDGSADGTDEG